MRPHAFGGSRGTLWRLALVVSLGLAAPGVTAHGAAPPPPGAPPVAPPSSVGHGQPVTIMGAGDIGGPSLADSRATAHLIQAADPDAVFTTGDNAYPDGTAEDYATRYDPAWGSFEDRTHPVPGNHDYHSDPPTGYLDYFGADVTNSVDGGLYYAWDVGNGWRAYAVNTEISTTGAQLTWLRADAAAHPGLHYLLHTHHPRYTSATAHGPSTDVCPLWNALAAAGDLEIVVGGHNHQYERFARMDCAGTTTPGGAVSFVVGSGGNDLYEFGAPKPGSEFRNDTDHGVLRLDLYPDSFTWSFLAAGTGSGEAAAAGQVLDSGSVATGSGPTGPSLAPSRAPVPAGR